MADFGALFTLMLVALTFVVVGMCFIVYIMIIGEREKRRLAESGSVLDEQLDEECPHHLGYLSGYPADQPVPEECFGCVNAIQCMNHRAQAAATLAEESAES
jgi:hypothetical protein